MRFVFLFLLAVALWAQSDDSERRLVNTQLQDQRPGAAKDAKPVRPQQALVGITLWRLRGSRGGDTARVLIHEGDPNQEELTPERVNFSAGVREGDRVRLSVES